jgi:hypothetical protein
MGFVFVCLVLAVRRAGAAEAAAQEDGAAAVVGSEAIGPRRRLLGVGAALVPGVLVHGTGHWVLGEARTARRLLLLEGLGLSAFFGGGTALVLSGSSRYLVAPAIPMVIFGVGLFSTTLLADIYGASGASQIAGEPERRPPVVQSEQGVRILHDPLLDTGLASFSRVDGRLGPARGFGQLESVPAFHSARYRLGVGWTLLGAQPERGTEDGTRVELSSALTEHHYANDGFVTSSAELAVAGRLALLQIGPSLRGAFAEFSTGLALAETEYHLPGLSVPPDRETLLLGRIGFGAELGHAEARGSEAMVYYDHRHDEYVGGLTMAGLGSGVAGHFGMKGRYWLSRSLGVGAMVESGAAVMGGLSLLFRAGGEP